MVMVDVDARMVAAIYISGLTDQVGWLGLGVGDHPGTQSVKLCVYQMNRVNSCHGFGRDDSTINIGECSSSSSSNIGNSSIR